MTTSVRKLDFSKVVFMVALAALGISFVLALWNYTQQARLALGFPYPLDYGEGPLLDQTLRLVDGEGLYHSDFSTPPYTVSNYPPLFLVVQMPLAKIWGPAFLYGRLISLLSVVLAAGMIGLILFTLTGDWVSSAAGGLLLLAFPYIQYWSLLNRIDSLALGLSWVALWLTIRWSDRRWGIPAAALFFIASIYTRQSYALAGPAGAFFWLLATRRWRKAGELFLIVGGVTVVLFLAINALTRGGFFLNIVTANVNPFYWNTVRTYARELQSNILLILIGSVAFLAAGWTQKQKSAWMLALPYGLAALASAITVGKDGSNCNYLFELVAAFSFISGALLAWLRQNRWVQAAALLLFAVQVLLMVQWNQERYNSNITGKTDQEPEIAQLAQMVRETDGIVLTDEYMGLAPLAGKRLYFQPFEFKMLAEAGLWDSKPFLIDIMDHKFAAVLWYDPEGWDSIEARWTNGEQEAIRASYRLETTIASTQILKPRK